MDVDIRASVDLVGSTLRYAEVEHYGDRRRLLRLGSCDFDYDASEHLFGQADPAELDPVRQALQDVFKRLSSDLIYVVLHPGNVLFFNSRADNGVSDAAFSGQLTAEAEYIASADAKDLRVFKQPLSLRRSSQDESWHAVVAVRSELSDKLNIVFSDVGGVDWTFRSNPFCAAQVATLLRADEGIEDQHDDGFELLVGWYDEFISYTVMQGETVLFTQHHEPTEPADCSYFGLQLLGRLEIGTAECTRVSLYGDLPSRDDFNTMAAISGERPKVLNPIELVDIEEKTLVGEFDASAYVPIMGAVL